MILSRYMTFERFVDMCKNELFLAPANYFLKNDPWEGLPWQNWQWLAQQRQIRNSNGVCRQQMAMGNATYTEADIIQGSLPLSRGKTIEALTWVSVSCWHCATEESMAMWRLYGQDVSGVCVETDVGNLKQAFESLWRNSKGKLYIMGRNVAYVDIDKGPPVSVGVADFEFADKEASYLNNPAHQFALGGLSLKHHALAFEKEFRVMCDSFMLSDEASLSVRNSNNDLRVRMNDFIRRVVVCPGMSNSMKDEVVDILKCNDFDCPVERSTFDMDQFNSMIEG